MVTAPDLVAAADAANRLGISVARVEQPYRVLGRRSPPAAPKLDAVWVSVLTQLRENMLSGVKIIVGGRSSGARVACRTAGEVGAVAVLCLAFPVHPPSKRDDPAKSRLGELDAVLVPTLVVQGENDPFGMPPPAPHRTVAVVPGGHGLSDGVVVAAAVSDWLLDLEAI
jgi:hypothetical protein